MTSGSCEDRREDRCVPGVPVQLISSASFNSNNSYEYMNENLKVCTAQDSTVVDKSIRYFDLLNYSYKS